MATKVGTISDSPNLARFLPFLNSVPIKHCIKTLCYRNQKIELKNHKQYCGVIWDHVEKMHLFFGKN